MARSPSYLKAAFLVPANLVALAAAGLATAYFADPAALLATLGLEALYLGLLCSAQPFRKAIRARSGVGAEAAAAEMDGLLADLSASQRQHYGSLRDLRDQILANYRRLPGGGLMVAASEQRVDALLTSFLRLLATLNSYRKYLGAADRKNLAAELDTLEAQTAGEANPRLVEVKSKRVEILRQRVQRFEQAEESREVVSHQLAGIEDLLKLTHECSIAIRDPASLGRQLEALTAEVQATDETVRELEQFMELGEEVRAPLSHAPRRTS